MTKPFPDSVHLFGIGRRAFQSGAGSGNQPLYPSDGAGRQGTIRVQHIQQPRGHSPRSCATTATIDLEGLFTAELGIELGPGNLEERVLSLARRPDQVKRRSWVGVGNFGKVQTPSQWRRLEKVMDLNIHTRSESNFTEKISSLVELEPLEIRSFATSPWRPA